MRVMMTARTVIAMTIIGQYNWFWGQAAQPAARIASYANVSGIVRPARSRRDTLLTRERVQIMRPFLDPAAAFAASRVLVVE